MNKKNAIPPPNKLGGLLAREDEKLDRLRMIRNNANYRGYSVSVQNAFEIREIWGKWGGRIAEGMELKLGNVGENEEGRWQKE